MSKRKRGINKSKLGRRYQSDFVNVTQKPRALIIDPRCARCRGTGKIRTYLTCPKCLGTGKDPEGDKWFDNHDRVKTTFGPKQNQSPLPESTFVKREWRDLSNGRKEGGHWVNVPVEREIPPTRKIGHTMVHVEVGEDNVVKATFETAASNAVQYTYDHLPRLKVVEKLEKLISSERRTIVERMDKYITISRSSSQHLKLFFAGDKYCYVEEFQTYARRSLVYTGRDYALARIKRIDWVEFLK